MLGVPCPRRIDDACDVFHAGFLNLFSFFGYAALLQPNSENVLHPASSGQSGSSIA
jgi:hypothetical protein